MLIWWGLFSVVCPRHRNKKEIYFLSGNTNNISWNVLKISEISLVLCARENTDIFVLRGRGNTNIFNTFDEIYLVFTYKGKCPLYHLATDTYFCIFLYYTLSLKSDEK